MIDPINTFISLLGVVVAFFVANYRGEMAATKYAQRETKRGEHERILITNPINNLKTCLYDINNVLRNSSQNIDIHQFRSPDTKFFYEHLKTGYPKLWQTIFNYENTYNRIAHQVDSIYQTASDLLEKKWGDDPNFNIEADQLKSHIKQIISHFLGEVFRRFVYGEDPQLARVHLHDPQTIMVGSAHIIIDSMIDREKVVNDMNSILEGSEILGELQQLWNEFTSLTEVRSQIHYDLDLMISLVHSGVHLEGWCTVGIAANYEHSQE